MVPIKGTVVGISIHRFRDLLGVTQTITDSNGRMVSLPTYYLPQQFAEFLAEKLAAGVEDMKNVQFLDSEFRTQRIGNNNG